MRGPRVSSWLSTDPARLFISSFVSFSPLSAFYAMLDTRSDVCLPPPLDFPAPFLGAMSPPLDLRLTRAKLYT